MTNSLKKIHINYYALLREERGISQEIFQTKARTAQELFEELKNLYHFRLSTDLIKVAINNEFSDWQTELKSEDHIVFIPPVAGG